MYFQCAISRDWWSMIIVVDAYNLLHAIPSYKKNLSDVDRKRFIALFSHYGRVKGHSLVLVFDGGHYERPFRERCAGVLVVSSGVHESADMYIKEYIEKHKGADLLLVSSDNDLNRYAQQRSVPSIDSVVFYRLLHNAMNSVEQKRGTTIVKTSDQEEEAIDILMKQASMKVPTKLEDCVSQRRIKQNKQSREERILLKKLNKL